MIRKCLFPSAGYGTRFLPATKAMPKEMLPIVNKPLIQYGVEEALNAGMNQIGFVTGRGKRAIEDHFDTNFEMEQAIRGTPKENYLKDIRNLIEECTFSYTRQRKIQGLGDAILTGETLIGNEPFGVILADDLCVGNDNDNVLSQMVKIFYEHQFTVLAIQEVDPHDTYKYGIIDGVSFGNDVLKVTAMVEKPEPKEAPSNLAIIGRYVLKPSIFSILKHQKPGKGGEVQITDALRTQLQSETVLAYKFKGKRFDCGSIEGFVDATNYFYQKRDKSDV